jgi:hypothetical protein
MRQRAPVPVLYGEARVVVIFTFQSLVGAASRWLIYASDHTGLHSDFCGMSYERRHTRRTRTGHAVPGSKQAAKNANREAEAEGLVVRGRVWHYHDTAFKVRLQNTAAGWCYQVYRWFKGDQLMAEGPPSPSAQAAVIDGMVWVENQTANPE